MKTRLKMFFPIAAFGILIAVIWYTPKEKNDVKVLREHMKIPKVNFHSLSSSTQNFFVKPCQE